MKIEGIGTVSKSEISGVLTSDGKKALEEGDLTWKEAGEMYKLQLTKRASKIGSMQDTFKKCYDRIPEDLMEKLSPEELGCLVDAFYNCYRDGKNSCDPSVDCSEIECQRRPERKIGY